MLCAPCSPGCSEAGPFLDVDTRRPLTKNVLSSLDLESRFYAVLSKAALKWPSVKSTPIEVPGTGMAKAAKVFE